ncbi:hypothetical protein Lesp02_46560 [Lentzea sp. NBRC 105346]|uniref:sigma-70 family RNA polymerase sigma factor n=1 Tax=Lentzea sp. NBRC 105346 TaxID=3032205 RepID=UPI0024A36BC8|nr:sigma-70 family RNA polymerase sigma factor [Lentzea sp. NBRC 105346]GLZ32468.1 hypothetical protein Lesp02_46560 [Lentzea sp. NBRC 105346]
MIDQMEATTGELSELVDAARAGDRRALDELVTECLPLVYSIVRRSLSSDADDVVQDTMIRVVRGIRGVREPGRFRSWLVAVTVNQIRQHRKNHRTAATPLLEVDDQADPNAEFVDEALTRLGMSRQRQEIELAAQWLDQNDRDLLALWALEQAGHLTRADVTSSLRLKTHHVTVRVSRLKQRVEATRLLVRALSATPRCPQLAKVAHDWSGEPTPLWRKRFRRHVTECRRCSRAGADLLPAERLLMGSALLALPAGYAASVLSAVHSAPPVALAASHGFAELVTGKTALVAAGATATIALVLGVVIAPAVLAPTAAPTSAPAPAAQVSVPSVAPTPTSAPAASSASATASASPTPVVSSAPPKPAPPPPPPASTPSAAERVLALINQVRAENGLPALKMDDGLIRAADAHTKTMMSGCGLSHRCPGEADLGDRESAAGVRWSSAGENIGSGGPVANAPDPIAKMALGLTQSMIDEKPPNDGHRQNILSSSFNRIGIVVTRDAKGTVWMTQDFAG